MPTFSPHSTQKPTWIYEADPSTAQFDNTVIKMGELASDTTHTANALISFDLSSLAGTVTSVTLTFDQPHDNGGSVNADDRTINVFRCRRPWTTGATWAKYDGTNNWGAAGGTNSVTDYDVTLGFDFNMLALLSTDMVIADATGMIDLVQDAIDNRSGLLSMIFFGEPAGSLATTEEWMSYFSANITLDVTIDSTPSVQAHTIVEDDSTDTTLDISWERGNGGNCVVFVKEASSGTASPVNTTTYTANAAFGSGTQIGATGWYAVYKGTGTSVTITGLSAETTYRVMVCEFNGSAGFENYNGDTASGNPANFTTDASVTAPTVQATNVVSIDALTTAVNVSWTRGNGDGCVLFVKQGNSGSAEPVDGETYTFGENFGEGTQIGSTGWYSVYVGTENSALLLGLNPYTNYRFHVCEFNGAEGLEEYNISTATGNPVTIRTLSADSATRNYGRPWGSRPFRDRPSTPSA